MATNNTRVAAYLPQDITDALNIFKIERGLIVPEIKDEKGLRANDSQALITILAEFFGVSQEVAHPSSLDLVKRIEAIEQKIEAHLVSHSSEPLKKASPAKPAKVSTPIVANQLGLEVDKLDPDTSPAKPDGQRWLSTSQAFERAKARGCDRNKNGFKGWSQRRPEQCLELYQLRRIEPDGGRSRTAPGYEDMNWETYVAP